jgi:DHA1 family inner membrane transport protein
VNLAGYHVKAVRDSLANRASGIFVTSLYGSAVFGGYLMGGIVGHSGWATAGEIQLTLLSLLGGSLALALRPAEMCL